MHNTMVFAESPTQSTVKAWLTRYLEREINVSPDLSDHNLDLASLGLDSVEMVSLIAALQRWLGRPVQPTLFWDCRTRDDLLAKICAQGLTAPANAHPSNVRSSPADEPHSFVKYINPYLGRKLQQLKMDKRFVRGEGCLLYDDEGRRYLDFLAQYGALPFGYNPPEIWDAIYAVRERMEPSFVQVSLLEAAGEVARRLIAVAPPGLCHVTFTSSGAESNEVAMKLARSATGRRGILSTHRGFHGKTSAALSASGKDSYQKPFGLPFPDFARIPYDDLDALAAALAAHPDHYAAFLVEPIQGEGGIVVPSPGYLRTAQGLCQRAGVLFVIDEVQTGLGRTGAMFASETAGIEPDILTLAKALGGGLMPIGACLCKAHVYRESFGLKHSSTFAGNTLAARAGLAVLDLLERDDRALLRRVTDNGARFKARLMQIQKRFPDILAEVRGHGYMLGLRLGIDRARWPENFLGIAAERDELAQLISSYLLNVEGVRVAPTLNNDDVLRIEPPLIATTEQCEAVADAIERTFEVLSQGDTALLYSSILARAPRKFSEPHVHIKVAKVTPRPEDARFAFVMHPLDAQTFVDYDRSLSRLTPRELDEFADTMDNIVEPFVGSEVRIVSPTGASAYGVFIVISRTAKSMVCSPHDEVMDDVHLALDIARQYKAEIVGLGAYTSIATGGGLAIADQQLPLTTGNSYTVSSAVEAVTIALQQSNHGWRGVSAAVVGAGGSIGRATACLLAEHAERLFLIGNPARSKESVRAQLLQVAACVCRHLTKRLERGAYGSPGSIGERLRALSNLPPSSAPLEAFHDVARHLTHSCGAFITTSSHDVLPHAEVVVAATSTPQATIRPEHLRRGAVVCDVSRPRNVSEETVASRDDVLVIDGGLISLPGRSCVGPYGIAPGLSYACMAETMILALERKFVHTGLGAELCLDEIDSLRRLGSKHGFKVAEVQRFGRPVGTRNQNSGAASRRATARL